MIPEHPALEAPDVSGQASPMQVVYRVNLSKVPLAEFRAGASLPAAILAWLLVRIFRVNLPTLPVVESLRDCEVPHSDMPESMREKYAAVAGDLATLGFRESVCYSMEDNLQ